MELKDFVTQTLVQIVAGVEEAQKLLKPKGAEVTPTLLGDTADQKKHGIFMSGTSGTLQNVHMIEFDVAVTVVQDAAKKEGIGVFLGSIGMGTQNSSATENTSVSRIKFKLPITLPFPPK